VCSDLHHIIRTAWEWKINSKNRRADYEQKLA
jgi:hypothetical protein